MRGPIKKSKVKIDRKRVGEAANMFISRMEKMVNRKGTALIMRNPANKMLLYRFCPLRVSRNREKKIRRKTDIIFRINFIFKYILISYAIGKNFFPIICYTCYKAKSYTGLY
jgi:hypothetical protein